MLEGKSPTLAAYDMPLDTWGECAEIGGVGGKGGPEQCDGSDWRVEVLTNLVSLDVSTVEIRLVRLRACARAIHVIIYLVFM